MTCKHCGKEECDCIDEYNTYTDEVIENGKKEKKRTKAV